MKIPELGMTKRAASIAVAFALASVSAPALAQAATQTASPELPAPATSPADATVASPPPAEETNRIVVTGKQEQFNSEFKFFQALSESDACFRRAPTKYACALLFLEQERKDGKPAPWTIIPIFAVQNATGREYDAFIFTKRDKKGRLKDPDWVAMKELITPREQKGVKARPVYVIGYFENKKMMQAAGGDEKCGRQPGGLKCFNEKMFNFDSELDFMTTKRLWDGGIPDGLQSQMDEFGLTGAGIKQD